MSYSSVLYLLPFLGGTLLLYNVAPRRLRPGVLLLASYIFYLWNSPATLVFLLLATALVYYGGLFLESLSRTHAVAKAYLPREEKKSFKQAVTRQKKAVCAVVLVLLFGTLAMLKYYGWLSESVNAVLSLWDLPRLPGWKLLLPLGISYYTLIAAGYLIDVYRGKISATRSVLQLALFLSFFPQIVEGPIARFSDSAEALMAGQRTSYRNLTFGAQRILWGLMKKMVVADRAAPFVAEVFGNTEKYGGAVLLCGGILFTVQIYMEFSGCMDIVLGSAELFGVTLPENFERPFFSASVSEFWRRWHITLGAWLRDYVFYSVSLSGGFARMSKAARARLNSFFANLIPAATALFCVWFCCGIWHGAGWKYLVYGMYYYGIMLAGMLCEPLLAKLRPKNGGWWFRAFCILRTWVLVVIGMTLFRAESLADFGTIVSKVCTAFAPAALVDGTLLHLGADGWDLIVIGIGCALILAVSLWQERGHSLRETVAARPLALRWCAYLALILCVVVFGAYGPGYEQVDFIYGQF